LGGALIFSGSFITQLTAKIWIELHFPRIFKSFLFSILAGFWKVLAKTQKSKNTRVTLVIFAIFSIQNFLQINRILKIIENF
jgi:asparagine N-glycosylation enzyme membrane subunit Stt3